MTVQNERDAIAHASDCALHNGPALPAGSCDCGVERTAIRNAIQMHVEFDFGEADLTGIDAAVDAIQKIIAARAPSPAHGEVVLVPREPTRRMMDAALDCRTSDSADGNTYTTWVAMIAAALSASPAAPVEAKRRVLSERDEDWVVASRCGASQLETYARQGKLDTFDHRAVAFDDALQHAVGILRLRATRQASPPVEAGAVDREALAKELIEIAQERRVIAMRCFADGGNEDDTPLEEYTEYKAAAALITRPALSYRERKATEDDATYVAGRLRGKNLMRDKAYAEITHREVREILNEWLDVRALASDAQPAPVNAEVARHG